MTGLVFDVGGTRLRGGVWRAGRLVDRRAAPSPGTLAGSVVDPVAELLRRLRALGDELLGGERPTAVGLAFPGPVSATGHVQQAPTLWGEQLARPAALAERAAATFPGASIRLVNDVTAAGYRYADELSDFCIVTVSSGIGSKLFVGGEVVVGPARRGGEIGHWQVDGAATATCECGGRGHLGAIASGRATAWHLAELERERPEAFANSPLTVDATNEALVAAYRAHDELATAVVRRGANALGRALALLHVGAGVERFIIYGGFAQALGGDYLDELRRAAAGCAWGDAESWQGRIVAAELDDDSGLVGMGVLLDRGASQR